MEWSFISYEKEILFVRKGSRERVAIYVFVCSRDVLILGKW